MSFLDKLERKYRKLGIPNLIFYLLFGQVIVFLLTMFVGPWVYNALTFNRALIFQGEIWRLISFIFIPNSTSLLWFVISVLICYSFGQQLERAMGTFGFNFYYFSSVIAMVIVALIFNISGPLAMYINSSLILALATLDPDTTFYFYGIIPIKAKWLVIFYFIQFGMAIFQGGFIMFLVIAASLTGYIIYFAIPALKYRNLRRKGKPAQKQFKAAQREIKREAKDPIKVAFHRCSVCGITEIDDPDMDFRYCSTCGKEFCSEHLKNHTH